MKFKFNHDKSKLILTSANSVEVHQLKNWLVRYVQGYRFMKRYKMGVWDGKIDHFKDGYIRFGLWHELYKCCKEHDFKFEAPKKEFPFDNNIKYEDVENFCKDFYKNHKTKKSEKLPEGEKFFPYEHQIESVFKILKYKYGLIEVATAGGKSLIFGTLIFYYLRNINPDGKILLIVPNISLVTQFYDDLLDYNLGFNNENENPLDIKIQEIMSDKPRKMRDGEPNVIIGTYQSLEKRPIKWFRQFDIVGTDESHTAKAKTLESVLSRTFGSADIRMGMSGTYPEDDTVEFLTIASLMGPKVMTVGAKKLQDKKLIADIKIKALLLNHNDKEFADNINMIKKSGDGKRAYLLEKEYIQKSIKRKKFVQRLVSKFEKNSLLLFQNIEYGKEIYNFLKDNLGMDFHYIDGGTSSKKRTEIKKYMEDTSGRIKVLVASYGTLSTGVSIKSLSNIIFLDSYKSDQKVRQSIGRGLRLHAEKNKLHVFDLVDIFHSSFKNILYNHYVVRRDKIYKKQQFPYDELRMIL